MGAGSTGLVVATIDFCNIEISKFLLEKRTFIDFITPLKKDDNKIPQPLQILAINKIKELMASAKNFKPTSIVFIPSKFFKETKNYMTFFKKIKKELKVKIYLPNLETEAILGYLGVKIKYPDIATKLLVWNTGAHGTNWTMQKNNSEFKVYYEKINPIIFKNMVTEGILKKDHKKINSPNPLGSKNTKEALELIKLYTTYNTPPELKKIANEFKVVGIGSFHNLSIMKQIGKKGASYNLELLESTLRKRENLKDKEIGGPYPEYQITNLIMAMGILNSMKLDQIHTARINMAHGALIYPKFWKKTGN